MTENQKKMIEKAGLNASNFERRKQDEPTQLDRIEAQVIYTALVTDTLLEGDADNV